MTPIEVSGLTKRFGRVTAVDDISFAVRPGEITGFLGRNGAGKTTTLRMILGLERPTAGTITVDGRPYAELADPLRHVGALLDARAVAPDRSAAGQLRALARSNRIGRRRVAEVLEAVGLAGVANQRAGTFSLGMLQRLGLAAALLGDPPILVLDEPLNGLDPEGIIWFRGLMRQLAREGRAVLLSSHLMPEMAVTADHLLIIGEGRLLADSSMAAFQRDHEHEEVRFRAVDDGELRRRIVAAGGAVQPGGDGSWTVSGLDAAAVGALAHSAGVQLRELTPVRRSLEDAFMELTAPRGPAADSSASSSRSFEAVALPMPSGRAPITAAAAAPPARFRDVLASELGKFAGVRTGPVIVAATVAGNAGAAALFANAMAARYPDLGDDEQRAFDPTYTVLRGRSLVQVTLGIVGALALTSEFSSGTIGPSLAAVPDRGELFAAKALTVAGVAATTGLAANAAAFAAGQALLARRGAPHDSLRTPGAARAVLGGAVHTTLAGLLGLGVGGLTRSTAGSVTTLFCVEWFIPGIGPAFPGPFAKVFSKYWLTEAGSGIFTTRPNPDLLRPWPGLGLLAASTAGVLGAAAASFRRRDV